MLAAFVTAVAMLKCSNAHLYVQREKLVFIYIDVIDDKFINISAMYILCKCIKYPVNKI